jgi:hypothetical protein
VTTDFGAELATSAGSCEDADGAGAATMSGAVTGVSADPVEAKPAIAVTSDFGVVPAEPPTAASPPSASACAVHRDAIEVGLSRGRNAVR